MLARVHSGAREMSVWRRRSGERSAQARAGERGDVAGAWWTVGRASRLRSVVWTDHSR